MKKILITRIVQPIAKELLSQHFEVVENTRDHVLQKNELILAMQNYDAILSTIPDMFNADVLSHATRTKVISNLAIGLDNIDLAAAKEKGIQIYNLVDVVTQSTADLTFAIFLSLIRHIPEAQRYVQENRWKQWEPGLFLGEELYGKTFAIFGFGQCGKAVAKRALAFGLKVIVFARRHPPIDHEEFRGEIRYAGLDEIHEKADYVSIHLPLTPETRGMFDLHFMRKFQKKPVLINMGRGPIVKTDDLYSVLKENTIRAAALDVIDPEPFSGEHSLCSLKNCLLVPHIGSATIECRTMMARKAAENIIKHYA